MTGGNNADVTVRRDLKRVLERIRQDESFQTYDYIIREAVRMKYPRYAFDL